MRIWAFPSFYPFEHPGLRWTGIFAHRQYKALAALGADIVVVQPVLWYPPAPFHLLNDNWKTLSECHYPTERDYDGLKVYHPRIANMKPGRLFRKPYADRYVDAIVAFFRQKGIQLSDSTDIFYAQWVPDAWMVQRAAKKLGIKSAVMVVGDDVLIVPQSGKKQMDIFIETMTNTNIRLSVAGYLANEANKLLPSPVPFSIVRRGVNHDFFRPFSPEEKATIRQEMNIPANVLTILMIGAPIARKGWLDLFDALAVVKQQYPNFVLLGVFSGHADIDLNTECKKRGLEKHFMPIGEVEPARMNKIHNAADIFCLASHSEGIANSVVEAMSTGVPVITTAICGHPELIANETLGVMVPPHRPDLLASAFTRLMQNATLRSDMGSAARHYIVNTWGNYAFNAARLLDILTNHSIKQ
jgi:glycosyltransferase involved in cell wall biosynthesis